MKNWVFSLLALLVWSHCDSQATIQVGNSAFYQTNNFNDTFNPRTAAPQAVSVTMIAQNPNAPQPPYKLHSWLGGMLWGNGNNPETSYNIPNSSFTGWISSVFPQKPVWADPVMLEYSNPPSSGAAANAAGVNLCLPFPYLMQDAPYTSCGSDWDVPPLQLQANVLMNLLVQPLSAAPAATGAQTPSWLPPAILVDRMGDWDVDLVFQNPASIYGYSTFANAGIGEYVKFTVAQGSPFVFVECNGVPFVNLANMMTMIQPLGAAQPVPGVSNVSYALIGGNQNNPGEFAGTASLNPSGLQDNFTTWAIYFKTSNGTNGASYTASSAATIPANNYLSFDNGSGKNWFVIAPIPTVMNYPTVGLSYLAATTGPQTNVNAYAQALGQYAFNFLTGTGISYAVTDFTFVQTTFQTSLENPYNDPTMVLAASTVMALSPHQYQPFAFDSITIPPILGLNGSTLFSPPSTSELAYWTVRGNLQAILGTSFQTNYIFSQFLPTMPPINWADPISNSSNGFSSTIGQFLFDNIDNEYISQTDSATAPWNTAYYLDNEGIYDIAKPLSYTAKQLGILNFMIQATELNAVKFIEQQYNNRPDLPYRPGAFNGTDFPPAPSQLIALKNSLQGSIQGSGLSNADLPSGPSLAGVQGAISQYFTDSPYQSAALPNLLHFAYYDALTHSVELFPVSAAAGGETIYPSPIPPPGPVPEATNPTTQLWEAFGVSALLDDHHYQYGYWIAAAALSALYDGAWDGTTGTWAQQVNYGTAIDQLVMDLAYDPSISASFYQNAAMTYPKMNFFDQWAGHFWADGLQGTVAGGLGHNENSIQEGNQAAGAIILWGMATGRADIVNLGIYLYTTATYAADAYFYDKNLNFKPGNAYSFVPTTTATGNPSCPPGSSFWDFTIHSSTSSGCPKLNQSGLNYSTDFGGGPPAIKFITAFPCTPWSLAIGRNTAYLNAWNDSMNTPAFQSLISTMNGPCWDLSYYANMNMLFALGGNTNAYGTTETITPYQYFIDLMTQYYPNTPPWVSIQSVNNQQYLDPSQSIAEVLHFLYSMQKWGTPDWSIYGNAGANLAFTSAFTLNGTTTYWAFNPGTTAVTVNFYKIGAPPTPIATFSVAPKQWGVVQN